MSINVIALEHDLRDTTTKLLSTLLRTSAEAIVDRLLNCRGDECVDEASDTVSSIVADAEYLASIIKATRGTGTEMPTWETREALTKLVNQAIDFARTLEKYRLLNTEFKNWLRRIQRRIERNDAKAIEEFVQSIGRLMHHAACNAHHRGLPLNIALFLNFTGDALNTLILSPYSNDTMKLALANAVAGLLALTDKVDEAFKFLGRTYGMDAEDLRAGTMRILSLCSTFVEMYEQGIVLTGD